MAGRTPKTILIAIVLWTVIFGCIASAVRYFVMPEFQEKKRDKLTGQTGSEGKYRHDVRLAADSFSGYCLFRSPDLAQRLSQAGIRFSVVDDGADYQKRMKALQQGDVEMAVFPVNSFIQCGAQLGEFPASIVYMIDETKGADAIVAYSDAVPDISSLNANEARIMVTPNSPSEFLARVMLASFNLPNLPESDWMITADGAAGVFKQFRADTSGKKCAYALWEPYVAKALRTPKAHVLIDSSKMQGFIVDVLVVRRQFLVDQYDVAKAVLAAYARTAYAHQANMQDLLVADGTLTRERIETSDAQQLAKGIAWKNTLENYAHFGLEDSAQSLENIEDILLKITNVLVKTGALSADPLDGRQSLVYFDRLLREMKDEHFHPGRELNIITDMDLGKNTEHVRAEATLRALTPEEWNSLSMVGELRVEPITFGRGTARINVQSEHELSALASLLNSWPQYYLTVVGRVRPGGDEEAALTLARERADAVVTMLRAKGITTQRIRALAEVGASNSTSDQSVSFMVGQKPY